MRAALLFLLLLALPAGADDLKEMARNVTDYKTKFELIAKGREAVPYLMAQLGSDDQRLVFESKSALRWIVNHAPADPKRRRVLAHELTLYCSKAGTRAFAAELLGDLGVPTTIGTLAAMLKGPDALAAVDALRRIRDPAAGRALVSAISGVEQPVRDAIYRALGKRYHVDVRVLEDAAKKGNAAAIEALGERGAVGEMVLLPLAQAGSRPAFDAAVRCGGALALWQLYEIAKTDEQRLQVIRAAAAARTMNLKLVDVLMQALETETLRVPAQHAILASVEATDAQMAAPFTRAILEDAKDPSVIVRALAGCARARDRQAVQLAVKHIDSKNLNIKTTAIGTLREIPGPEATNALLETFQRVESPPLLVLVIQALGRRGDASAADALAAWMKEGPEEVRKAAVEAYVALAHGATEEKARAMYLHSLEFAASRAALEGLARVGDASCLDKLAQVEGEAARDAMVAIATRLEAAGRREDAVAAYRRALDAGAPVANRLRLLGEQITYRARGGRVHAWWIIGGFPAPDIESWGDPEFPEKSVELKAAHSIGDRTVRWEPVEVGGDDAIVDLNSLLTPNDNVTGYAYAEIEVKKERDVVFKMGSDDGIRCWVNGELVHQNHALRGVSDGEDTVEVKLRQGKNTLLVKVCEKAGGWAFYVRIEDDQGRPLKFRIR